MIACCPGNRLFIYSVTNIPQAFFVCFKFAWCVGVAKRFWCGDQRLAEHAQHSLVNALSEKLSSSSGHTLSTAHGRQNLTAQTPSTMQARECLLISQYLLLIRAPSTATFREPKWIVQPREKVNSVLWQLGEKFSVRCPAKHSDFD